MKQKKTKDEEQLENIMKQFAYAAVVYCFGSCWLPAIAVPIKWCCLPETEGLTDSLDDYIKEEIYAEM